MQRYNHLVHQCPYPKLLVSVIMYNMFSMCFKLTQKHDQNVYIICEAHKEMIQIPFKDHLDTKFPCPLKDKHTHKNTFRSTEKLSWRNHTLILPWNKYLWFSWFFMLITLHSPLGCTLLAKIHLICIAAHIALSIVW